MADTPPSSLTDLLARLELVLAQPVALGATDTASVLVQVRVLTAATTYTTCSELDRTVGHYGE